MFNLPGRGFRQLITSTSSVPMTLVSVDGCSGFPDPDGFLDLPDSSFGFLVYSFHSLPVYDVVFSCRMAVRANLLMVDINVFFRSLCISNFSCCLCPFCVPSVVYK